MAGPPVEVQVRVNVGVVAFSSEVSLNCTEDTTTFPVEINTSCLIASTIGRLGYTEIYSVHYAAISQ